MPKKKQKTTDVSKLRQRAEAVLKVSSVDNDSPVKLSSDEMKTLIHDLDVHQIELEMQNVELSISQAKLDIERDRYFDFYNMAPVGFFSVDEQKLILECNLTAATLLGRSQNEIVKQQINRFILKEDQDIYCLHNKQVFESDMPQECDLRMLKNDGSLLWVHLATTAVYNAKGAIVTTIMMSDITDRKRTEDEREQALSQLQTTLDATADGILVVDMNGKIVLFNKRFAKMWKLQANISTFQDDSPVLAIVMDQLKNPDAFRTKIKELYADSEAKSLDTIEFNDGRIFERYSRSHLLNNEVIGRVWSFRDVTDRKQTEDELSTIFNLSPDMICEANLDGYFKKLNPAWEDALGFTIEELCSKPYINFIHPNDQKLTMKEAEKLFSGKSTIKFENRYLCKNGSYKSLEWNSPPFNSNGLVYAVARDITKRKQMLEALNNSEKKLKKLNEELEDKIKQRTASLENLNTALSVLLKKRDDDKNQIGKNIYHNFKSLIQPLMNQLRNSLTINVQEDILNILESSIKEITTPFSKKMSDPIMGLTPTEIQVASLVKNGKTNKEIVQLLNKSIRTVSAHRENIRLKFGLKNKKVNLKTYLLSLD